MKSHTENSQSWIIAVCLMLFMVFATFLHAQLSSTSITGTVTDPSGAVVPGALITLVNKDTSIQDSGRSNESGIYLVPSLSPGSYTFR